MAIGTNMFSDLVPASGGGAAAHALASAGMADVRIQPGTGLNQFGRSAAVTGTGVAPAPAVVFPGGTTPLPVPVANPTTPGTTGGTPAPAPAPAPAPSPAPTPTPAPAGGATPPPTSALDGWTQFYNSPAYQVPLAEGLKGVNTKYAALGAIESGAAMKAINDYAAGHAASALSTYMDDLYRQEALGMSAASALAGVGQNMVSQVSANNNAAGSAAGNAALVGGQANANNWTNIGSAVGTAAGGIAGALGSSYGATPSLQSTNPNGPNYIPPFPGGY